MAKETYTDYLRRVGSDYAESGCEATAEDYNEAADRIDALEAEIKALKRKAKKGGR
jgi:hypothetical protein